jgi:hypothetical protein
MTLRASAHVGRDQHCAPFWRGPWWLTVLLASVVVQCRGSCPEGSHARFDQCIRLSGRGDAGADASLNATPREADAANGAQDADALTSNVTSDAAADGMRTEASTNDGAGHAGCDVESMWRDGRCVLREVYVDAENGNDTNDGTLGSPLKTFKKAMSEAVEYQIFNFAPGCILRQKATRSRGSCVTVSRCALVVRTAMLEPLSLPMARSH